MSLSSQPPHNAVSSAILEIDCPICGEVLALTPEDRAELQVGDVMVCDSCNAEMEIIRNSGEDFELELLGILSLCPACEQEFDLTDELLTTAPTTLNEEGETVSLVHCPHCKAAVEVSFEDA